MTALKRVFDNAQGRKPRGRDYGVCLELGTVDVVVSGVNELSASLFNTFRRPFLVGQRLLNPRLARLSRLRP